MRSFSCILLVLVHVSTQKLDLNVCKLSHSGVDYRGRTSRSYSGPRCRFWDSRKARNERITDADFPDGSRKAASNRCRNPTGQRLGPWCYTKDPAVASDICDVPLCASKACRVTGAGMEYAGDVARSSSDQPCLEWSGISKYRRDNPGVVGKFSGRYFPDASVRWAGRKCRNPDAWAGGPWCYVKSGASNKRVERAHCDVPLCEPRNCTVFTTYDGVLHSDYTELAGGGGAFAFSIKLWDPADWKTASARVAFSLVTGPATGRQQLDRKTGFELLLSNADTHFTGFEGDAERVPGLLNAANWSELRVTWGDEYLTLLREGVKKPVLVQNFPTAKRSRDGTPRVEVRAYALSGRHVQWGLPACGDDCPLHTASAEAFSRLWEVRQSPTGPGAQVFVRSRSPVCLHFRGAPTSEVPDLRVCVDHGNASYVAYRRGAEANVLRLKQVDSRAKLLSWWAWRELSVTLSASTGVLSVWARSLSGPGVAVLEVEVPEDVRGPRWFGVAPLGGVALFTLFCVPKEPDPPMPPECHRPGSTAPYSGSDWTTATGLPCLPWSGPDVPVAEELRDDALFPDGSREAALDRCRNVPFPDVGERGTPFCYATSEDGQVGPALCAVRECRAAHCRIAGTANDYMGARSVTRAGLACRPWAVAAPPSLSNETLYPEQNVTEASNFCRNPSRSVAGTWCFTDLANVTKDLCDVRDCVKPEECTIVYPGGKPGGAPGTDKRALYILPAWRMAHLAFSLKTWNPETSDGIVFDLRPAADNASEGFHRLAIGADRNEKVAFSFVDGQGREEVLDSKTVPHIVSSGKWASLWLRFALGRVLLGQQGVETPIFDWPYKQGDAFTPSLLGYQSVQNFPIGLHLDCPNEDCLIERVDADSFTKLFPINIWRPGKDGTRLQLAVQGTGVAKLALFRVPEDDEPPFVFRLGADKTGVSLSRGNDTLHRADLGEPVLHEKSWAYFHFHFRVDKVVVQRNGTEALSWPGRLLAYFFSVAAERGVVNWAANCVPVDLSGEAVHGAWSPWGAWTCSAACGGGHGERTRTCTQPAPNILGRPCAGEATMHGPCNDWPCNQLSPASLHRVHAALLRPPARQLHAQPGARLRLQCDAAAVAAVFQEAPKAVLVWVANGDRVQAEPGRVEVSDDGARLRVLRARESDSGAWACVALRALGGTGRVVLRVWAVTVRTTLQVRRTLPARLRCGALQLAQLYDQLQVSWTQDGRRYKVELLCSVHSHAVDLYSL